MLSLLRKAALRRSAFFARFLLLLLFCAGFHSPASRAEENAAPTADANTTTTATTTPAPTPAETAPALNAAETSPGNSAAPQRPEDDRLTFMADDRAASNSEAPSTFGLLAKSFGALLVIVGLIFAAGWGLKRYGGARFGAVAEDAPVLSVLSSVSLGDRRSLAVVRFGARTLLVGSTQQSITLLAEEKTAEENEAVADYPPARSVAEMLKQSDSASFASELDEVERRHHHRRAPARLDWGPDETEGEAC